MAFIRFLIALFMIFCFEVPAQGQEFATLQEDLGRIGQLTDKREIHRQLLDFSKRIDNLHQEIYADTDHYRGNELWYANRASFPLGMIPANFENIGECQDYLRKIDFGWRYDDWEEDMPYPIKDVWDVIVKICVDPVDPDEY